VYGGWESYYAHGDGRGDQSRADQALVNMIAHYTDNMDQVTRMFLASQLGQRDKAQKRPAYVRQMVVKSFDQKQPTMDETQRNAWRANIMQSGQKVKQQYHNGNGKPKQTKLRGILDRMPDGLIRSMTESFFFWCLGNVRGGLRSCVQCQQNWFEFVFMFGGSRGWWQRGNEGRS